MANHWETHLKNGFNVDTVLEITFRIFDDADRLEFNLVCGEKTGTLKNNDVYDIALHFSPRFDESVIVRNTFQNGQWGGEEKGDGNPMKVGLEFVLKFICATKGYHVLINGAYYTFYCHRISPQKVTHLKTTGPLTLLSVVHKIPSKTSQCHGLFFHNMEVLGQELPFKGILRKGFGPGCSLEIAASVHSNADWITFNLECDKAFLDCDIALHFNPRLKDNVIVRNTYKDKKWGQEERANGNLIKAGSNLSLKIICLGEGYRVQVNGAYYTLHYHRMPPQNVTHLSVSGLLSLQSVVYKYPYIAIDLVSSKKEKETTDYVNDSKKSSWNKVGAAKYSLENGGNYKDCGVNVEWTNSENKSQDSGTLTLFDIKNVVSLLRIPFSKIVAVIPCSDSESPRFAIHTPCLESKIVKLEFANHTEMKEWFSHIDSVTSQVNNWNRKPRNSAMWATTTLGDVYVYDPTTAERRRHLEGLHCQQLEVTRQMPFTSILRNGFKPGSILEMSIHVNDNADRMAINLECSKPGLRERNIADDCDTAFHFNPRLRDNVIVRNTCMDGKWSKERKTSNNSIKAGSDFTLKIICHAQGYDVKVNGADDFFYRHQISPHKVTHSRVWGSLKLLNIEYKYSSPIIEPLPMFWRKIEGNLKKVETCGAGITWGIDFNNTPWVYTEKCNVSSTTSRINQMVDTYNYYVFENQCSISGNDFDSENLPMDIYAWSNVTGQQQTRETTKLSQSDWQWVSNWIVDFHTPGGVDHEGWQYAMNFSSEFHPSNSSGNVRRRRWIRMAQSSTSSSWQELENTKLIQVFLHTPPNHDGKNSTHVWAVGVNGKVLYRHGVSESCPMGVSWEHVQTKDEIFVGISCSPKYDVWALEKNGSLYRRLAIKPEKPTGSVWQRIDYLPADICLKQFALGDDVIWALDTSNQLSTWRGIQKKMDTTASDGNKLSLGGIARQVFRHVSVGPGQIWIISNDGKIYRKMGVTKENPIGTIWVLGIGENWQHISASGLYDKADGILES